MKTKKRRVKLVHKIKSLGEDDASASKEKDSPKPDKYLKVAASLVTVKILVQKDAISKILQ